MRVPQGAPHLLSSRWMRFPSLRRLTFAGLIGVLLLLLGALGMNLYLNGEYLPRLLGSELRGLKLQYSFAWSIWPGRVHVEDLSLSGEEHGFGWQLRAGRAQVATDVGALLDRELSLRRLVLSDAEVTIRPRLHYLDVPPHRFEQALFVEEGPTPPPSPTDPQDDDEGWAISIPHVEVDALRRLEVGAHLFEGHIAAAGSVSLSADRVLTVGTTRVEVDRGTVRVDGELVAWNGREAASIPGGTRLAVSYVGLSYLMSERIRYRTRLEGLDQGWVERGNQRAVEYIGLPPGDYTLHVAAAHPGGDWGRQVAAWHFTVQPFWWQRTSVRVLAGVLLLVGGVALYRFRLHRYRVSNLRLARRVEEATADLQAQTLHLQSLNLEKTELAERLARQAEAFERQAREDALTGLANRRAFDEALGRDFARARRSGHPLCLVVLDIDHFKHVNDRYSHSVGDAVLAEVALLLDSACRDSDMSARTGGEEFALLLNDTRIAEAEKICERLRTLFHAHGDWGGVAGLRVTFSAGLVELGGGDRSPSMLYQRADSALYQAKRGGRDRICTD